jgi:hypothetical protein
MTADKKGIKPEYTFEYDDDDYVKNEFSDEEEAEVVAAA